MCVFREREACDLHLCYSVCVCSSVSHCKCVYLTELLCSFFWGVRRSAYDLCSALAKESSTIIKQRYTLFSFSFAWENRDLVESSGGLFC